MRICAEKGHSERIDRLFDAESPGKDKHDGVAQAKHCQRLLRCCHLGNGGVSGLLALEASHGSILDCRKGMIDGEGFFAMLVGVAATVAAKLDTLRQIIARFAEHTIRQNAH